MQQEAGAQHAGFFISVPFLGTQPRMDNDRTMNESDVQDENLRDRNITDSGERLTGTRARSEKGETGSIRDNIDTNTDTDTASEDIGSRSDLGVGE